LSRFARTAIGVLGAAVLFASVSTATSIKVRVDTNGRKVFYNTPSFNSTNTGSDSAVYAIYYSSKATNYVDLIQTVSSQYSVDAELVKAMVQVESNYNPWAVSPKGARGLMQLMPATAIRYGVREIFDPQQNVDGGVRYLRDLLNLFSGDLTLTIAAYNAGEGAVQKYNDVPDYEETQNYVRKVLALYRGENSYTSYNGPARKATYYKYVDSKGVTHYSLEPVSDANTVKVSFSY
jgi:soluble lytic murein transglycosylase-like protein